MSKLLVVTLVTVGAGVSLWGWGRAVTRMVRAGDLPASLTAVLGLAALVFIGGLLNSLHLAYAATLDAVAISGVVLAAIFVWKGGGLKIQRPGGETLLALVPLLVTGWFLASHLLPQSAYNVHDDLEKYFAHPVAMLAHGSFGSNPLNSLGGETLGGQAFLQSFVVAHLPLSYLGAFDSYFCVLLCVAVAAFAVKPRPWAAGAVIASLALLAINPQVVNIGAVFSAVALTAAVLLLPAHAANPQEPEPSAPLLGLLYAGLIVLKTTFMLFVAVHFVVLAAGGLLLHRSRWRWAWTPPAWTLLFLAPWLALHARLYLAHPPLVPVPAGGTASAFEFLSSSPVVYGAIPLHYTLIAVLALVVGFGLLALLRGRHLAASLPVFAAASAGITAGVVYFTMLGVFGPLFSGATAALRYTCPILIAAVPVLLRLTESVGDSERLRRIPWIMNCLGFAVILAFLPGTGIIAIQIARLGSPLAYLQHAAPSARANYINYNRGALDPSGALHAKLAAIQALIPEGKALGAWVMTPYLLDFKRNPVFPTDPAGLSMRWSRRPREMRYFLYEYAGSAVRPMSDYQTQLTSTIPVDRLFGSRTLAFLAGLQADTAHVLYDDGAYLLVELRPAD